MSDRFTKLLEVVSENDKKELALGHNSKINAMRICNERFSKSAKDDYDAARAMLDETIERFWLKYFPEDQPAPEGERFKNRKQAFGWLQAQGYKVSNGKFYGDCDSGFPQIHKDGTVSRYQVLQYGQQLDVERRSSPATPGNIDRDEYEARKIKADAEKAEMQAESMRREMDADWLHKTTAYAQMAALIGTLADSLRHQFNIGSTQLAHLAGGDPQRAPEIYEGLEEILARSFNEINQQNRIDTMFAKEPEE